MKFSAVVIVLLFFNIQVMAKIQTRILHINGPESINDYFEVLFAKERQVLKVYPHNLELIEKIENAYRLNASVEFDIQNDKIVQFSIIDSGDDITDFYLDSELTPMSGYIPSNVESFEKAVQMFGYLKNNSKWFTQCFNRAHIWAKQMHKNDHIDSMKLFIFYTSKYRRELDEKWWFHVAPMIDINGQYYVLDKTFFRMPVIEAEWENHFTRKLEDKNSSAKGYRCKVITNIGQYYDKENQKNEYCNLLVSSMYYWMPLNLSELENKGTEKTNWVNSEIISAAKEIFWRWGKVYDEIRD